MLGAPSQRLYFNRAAAAFLAISFLCSEVRASFLALLAGSDLRNHDRRCR